MHMQQLGHCITWGTKALGLPVQVSSSQMCPGGMQDPSMRGTQLLKGTRLSLAAAAADQKPMAVLWLLTPKTSESAQN